MRARRVDGDVLTVAQAADEEPLQELPAAAFPAQLTIERVTAANAL